MSFEDEYASDIDGETASTEQPDWEQVGDSKGGGSMSEKPSQDDDSILTEIQKEIFSICKIREFTDTLTEAFVLHAPTLDDWCKDPDVIKTLAKNVHSSRDKKLTGEDRFIQITNIKKTQDDIGRLYSDRLQPDVEYQSRQVDEQERKRIAEIRATAARIEYNKARNEGCPDDVCTKRARQAAVDAEKAEREPTTKDMANEKRFKKLQEEKQEAEEQEAFAKTYPSIAQMMGYIEEEEWAVIGREMAEYAKPIVTPDENVLRYKDGIYDEVNPKYNNSIDILTNEMLYNVQFEEEPDTTKLHAKFLQERLKQVSDRNNIARSIKADILMKWDDIQEDTKHVAFNDTLVTIDESGKVVTKPFTPDVMLFHKIPWDFPTKPTPHPKFTKFVIQICREKDGKRNKYKEGLVWQLIAMCIMRNIWGIQLYWQLLGEAGTGKGTLIEIINLILGEKNTESFKLSTFSSKDEGGFNVIGLMADSLFAYDPDTRHMKYFEQSWFSDITGLGVVKAHTKYKTPRDVRIRAVVLLASTKIPYEIGNTLLRRMELIEFCNKVQGEGITGTVDKYHEQMIPEIPGIIHTALRWAERITMYRQSGKQGELKLIGSLSMRGKQEVIGNWQPHNPVNEIMNKYFEPSDDVITFAELRDMVHDILIKMDYKPEEIMTFISTNVLAKHEMVMAARNVSGHGAKRTYSLKMKSQEPQKFPAWLAPHLELLYNNKMDDEDDTAPVDPDTSNPGDETPGDETLEEPDNTTPDYTPSHWPDDKPSPKDVIQKCDEYKLPHGTAKAFVHKIDDHYQDGNRDLIISETVKFWNVQDPDVRYKSDTLKEILNWFTSCSNNKA